MPRPRKEKSEVMEKKSPEAVKSKKSNPWTTFVRSHYSKEKHGSLRAFLTNPETKKMYLESKK